MKLVRWFAADLHAEDLTLSRENVAAGAVFLIWIALVWVGLLLGPGGAQ